MSKEFGLLIKVENSIAIKGRSFELAFKVREPVEIDIEGPEEALDCKMLRSQLKVTWLLVQTSLKAQEA